MICFPQLGHRGSRGLARLGEYHQPLGAASGLRCREGGDAPLADFRDIAHGPFEFFRVQIAACPDNEILDPAGHIELSVDEIAEITGV